MEGISLALLIQIFKGFKSTLPRPAPQAGRGKTCFLRGRAALFSRGGTHIPDLEQSCLYINFHFDSVSNLKNRNWQYFCMNYHALHSRMDGCSTSCRFFFFFKFLQSYSSWSSPRVTS